MPAVDEEPPLEDFWVDQADGCSCRVVAAVVVAGAELFNGRGGACGVMLLAGVESKVEVPQIQFIDEKCPEIARMQSLDKVVHVAAGLTRSSMCQ